MKDTQIGKQVVFVFDVHSKPQQVLIDTMLKVQVNNKDWFRGYLHCIPTFSPDRLRNIYEGLLDPNTCNPIENPRPDQKNRRALRILEKTDFEMGDRVDCPKWSHLGIVFPTRRGKITQSIKYIHKIENRSITDPVDGTHTFTEGKKFWKERFDKMTLVLMYDRGDGIPKEFRGSLPSPEAIDRYDRIWVVHEETLRKLTQKCTHCDETMKYVDFLTCISCGKVHKKIYPIPKKYPKCSACDGDLKKVLFKDKLICEGCGRRKKHKRVSFMGSMTPPNLEKFDFINEYLKAMKIDDRG